MEFNNPIEVVMNMTTNLLYLAVGVFGIVGGFLSTQHKIEHGLNSLLVALGLFAVSLFSGLFLYMRLADRMIALQKMGKSLAELNLNDGMLRTASGIQILSCGAAALAFGFYLWHTLTKR